RRAGRGPGNRSGDWRNQAWRGTRSGRGIGLGQRVERRMPGERRALDTGRKRVHARECGHLRKLLGFATGGHDVLELVEQRARLGDRPTTNLRGHQRRARLRARAACTFKARLLDPVADNSKVDGAGVATRAVVAAGNAIRLRQLATVPWTFVVVENDRLVEVGEIGHGTGERRAAVGSWQLGADSNLIRDTTL